MRTALPILLAAAVAMIPTGVGAQELVIGSRARVHQFDGYGRAHRHTGVVVALSRDSIEFESDRRAFRFNETAQVDVQFGKRRRPVAGMFKGAAIGALTGAVMGAVACVSERGCRTQQRSESPGVGGSAFLGSFAGMVVGAPIGLAIGSRKAYAAWVPVWPAHTR